MPSWIETQLAIRGLLRLARFDPDFTRHFDQSPRGALRSFWLALPLFAFHLWAAWPIAEPMPASLERYFAAMSVAYLYLWILTPLVIIWVAPLLDKDDAAPGCITIYNWMNLLAVALFTPILLLDNAGFDADLLIIPTYGARLIFLAWAAFMFTHTLGLPLWQGALASIADYFITQRVILSILYTLGMSAGS